MCKRTMCKRARIPMGTTRMRKQWCPGRFSSPPQKRPGNEANHKHAVVTCDTFIEMMTGRRESVAIQLRQGL